MICEERPSHHLRHQPFPSPAFLGLQRGTWSRTLWPLVPLPDPSVLKVLLLPSLCSPSRPSSRLCSECLLYKELAELPPCDLRKLLVPVFELQHYIKPGMVEQRYQSFGIILGNMHSKSEASLGNLRLCLKRKEKNLPVY